MIAKLLTVLILSQAITGADANTIPSTLDAIEKKIYSLEQTLNFILKETVIPEETALEIERFSKRFARAETLFYLQDYQAASILLFDIVEDKNSEKEPQYWDAVNLLAESLYNIKNYYGARSYFNNLLTRGDKKYFYTALERVIRIASITNNYDGLERYYEIVNQLPRSAITSGIYFTLGKTLYKRGDLTRASEVFGRIDENSEYYINGMFYRGVIEVKKKNYNKAIEIFNKILSLEPQTPEHRDLKEQAILAIGRLYYEMGDFDRALEAYQNISKDSIHFEEALYEVSWIFVKKGAFDKAKQTLEIMLLSTNETPTLLNAKALYGSVMMKLGDYNAATENFQEMIDRYYPVKEQLRSILEERDNPVEYFEELLLKEPDGMALKKVLPPVAFDWASTDSKVKKALAISTDIRTNLSSIDEVINMADAIEEKLRSADRAVVFPQLRDAKLRAADMKIAIDELRRQLNSIRSDIVSKYISPDEQRNLEEIKRKKEELKKIVESLPKDSKELEVREKEVVNRIAEMEKLLHQLNVTIEGFKAQLFAIEKWLNDNRGKLGEKEKEEEFYGKVKMEWDNIKSMEQDVNAYTAEIKKEKARIGALEVLSEGEVKRAELKKLEEEERRLLNNFKDRLSQDDMRLLNRTDNLIERLARYEEEFKKFDERIDRVVDRKARALIEIVQKEKKNLKEYKENAGKMEEDSKELIGKIGYSGFRQVSKLFSDLVMKADVGIVDVAWKQKEELDRKIEKLRGDQEKELKAIKEEYEFDLEK